MYIPHNLLCLKDIDYNNLYKNNMIVIFYVCRNYGGTASANCFTQEGEEQIEKAVRERNSAGDILYDWTEIVDISSGATATTYIKHAAKLVPRANLTL